MATPLSARETRARELVDALAAADALRQKFERYHTTTSSCGCMDWQVRGRRNEIKSCYHILALRLMAEREKSHA
ncbi:MAG: hypothetical protein MUP86_02445 [Dehalococcoidia bacterium]|nr:hypothetical protein [Dehalococcoidia bacterium]